MTPRRRRGDLLRIVEIFSITRFGQKTWILKPTVASTIYKKHKEPRTMYDVDKEEPSSRAEPSRHKQARTERHPSSHNLVLGKTQKARRQTNPATIASTTVMAQPAPAANTRSRIPASLQAVFLASNRGREVDKPPPNQAGNKVSKRPATAHASRTTCLHYGYSCF